MADITLTQLLLVLHALAESLDAIGDMDPAEFSDDDIGQHSLAMEFIEDQRAEHAARTTTITGNDPAVAAKVSEFIDEHLA